ncbi:hypothetical protein ACEUCP_07980 [Aeromonas caviae]|uniref:hypothetical protein n=1 Tax=Aeromonas caviae TaxID=648 RepID=UPI0013A6D9F7|nr:hypothetical protein [Aeromonas caviae]
MSTFMPEKEFIEVQRLTYGVTETILESQLQLSKRLGLGVVNEQAIEDISAFRRAGHFVYDPEMIMPAYWTSGIGLPVRLIVYYDRMPVAYAVGAMTNDSIDINYWEMSTKAPQEIHVHWIPILTASLEDLSVFMEKLSRSEISVEKFAFTSPTRCDSISFESAGFTAIDNYCKGIPAVVTYRK